VQEDLKQIPLEDTYTVVDNRKGDHRYKYDQKIQYIEKKQVDEAAEMMKVMEETPETIVGPVQLEAKQEEIFKEVAQKEVIENKVTEEKGE
jgi:leucyl aminopeptidase